MNCQGPSCINCANHACEHQINVVNATPHAITFWRPGWEDTVTVPPCGVVINARPLETPVRTTSRGITFVKTQFVASVEEDRKLRELEEANPGAIIVGSIIAAQAFPGRVVAMVPAPGYERVAPEAKRMLPDKFTIF